MQRFLEVARRTKWPTVAALMVLLGATYLDWHWVWGLFFIYWTVTAVVTRQTFVVQTVRRDENPVLFWLICVAWLILAVLVIAYDVFPEFAATWTGD